MRLFSSMSEIFFNRYLMNMLKGFIQYVICHIAEFKINDLNKINVSEHMLSIMFQDSG